MQKLNKIRSISAIAEHDGDLESFLDVPKGQTTSSTLTINHCYGLREGLKTLTSSTPTNNHCYDSREGLETQTSFAPTNNDCRGFKKGLEI